MAALTRERGQALGLRDSRGHGKKIHGSISRGGGGSDVGFSELSPCKVGVPSPDHFWNSLGGAQRKSAEFMGQIGSLRKGWREREGEGFRGPAPWTEAGLWRKAAGLILATRGRLEPGNEAAPEAWVVCCCWFPNGLGREDVEEGGDTLNSLP